MAAMMDTFACNGCGANLAYAAGQQALKCEFCDAVTEIARPELALEETAELIIPLTVEKRTLEQAVYRYMASGSYTPDDLVEHAVLSKVERFYVPVYEFSGTFDAQWTASFGYDRRESYTQFETRMENGRSRQVPVTKTRTVTDWSPVNGSDSGSFAVLAYSGNALSKEVINIVEHSSGITSITEFNKSFVSGLETHPFTVTERETYSKRGLPQINSLIDDSVQRHAQGDRQRDWHWTANIDKDTFSVLAPLCHVVFEYEGKQYNVWTDGGDVSRLVADPLPTDEKRKRTVSLGFVPAGATTAALLLAGLLSDGLFSAVSGSTLAITAAAWGYGFWRRHLIIEHSVQSRQSVLAQREASATNLSTLSAEEGSSLANSFTPPEKPWVLQPKKDKGALIAASVVLSSAVFLATFGGGTGQTAADETAAAAPVVEAVQPAAVEAPPAVQVIETPTAEIPVVVAPEQEEAPAPVNATEQPTAEQAPATEIGARKTEHTVEMLKSAFKGDWAAVSEHAASLKQFPAESAGDRVASTSANAAGLRYLKQKDYPSAIASLNQAVTADPSNLEARNNLGFALLQSGDHDKAIGVIGDLLQMAPERDVAWLNMAQALAQNGKPDYAEASLRLALRYSNDRKRSLAYLGRVVAAKGSEPFGAVAERVLKDSESVPLMQ